MAALVQESSVSKRYQRPEKDAPKAKERDELSLEDTVNARVRVAHPGKAPGYNPYDVHGGAGKAADATNAPKPKTDLRELSKWIQMHRSIEELKATEGAPPSAEPKEQPPKQDATLKPKK